MKFGTIFLRVNIDVGSHNTVLPDTD